MTEKDDWPEIELVYDPSIAEEYGKEHPELYQPVPVEIEGDRFSWWYVCGECHKAINPGQEKCDGCGRRQQWENDQKTK